MDVAHQGGAPAADDWRSQLQPEGRSRIVNKIMETLRKHLPVSVPEGLTELRAIAVRFEEKIFAAATSQSDYLRKISLKMLSMERQNRTGAQENPVNGQAVQNQRPYYQASSGSTSRAGYYPRTGGFKEELHQMNKTLKEQYVSGLSDLHEIYKKLNGDNHVPTEETKKAHEENFKLILERSLDSVQINNRSGSVPTYKSQMMSILNSEEWNTEKKTSQQSAVPAADSEIQEIAAQIEEEIYAASTCKADHLSKIYQKKLSFVSHSHTSAQQNTQVDQNQKPHGPASEDSTAQSDHTGAGNWQEEVYQMISVLKNLYLPDLTDLHNKLSLKIQYIDNHMPAEKLSIQYEKMEKFKLLLERALQFLQTDRSAIQISFKDIIPRYERQIVAILNSQKRKPVQTIQRDLLGKVKRLRPDRFE